MLQYTPAAKQVLHTYLDTIYNIRRHGLEDKVRMSVVISFNSCGTACCIAGWYGVFAEDLSPTTKNWNSHAYRASNKGVSFLENSVGILTGETEHSYLNSRDDQYIYKLGKALFGENQGNGPDALDKLARRAFALLNRIESYEAYIEEEALPKKERIARQRERVTQRET
jgi:hypothetical protein